MKSRPLTYLLLVAALGVWGVVAWKLFSSGPKPSAVTPAAVLAVGSDTRTDDDTLRLDYGRQRKKSAPPPSSPARGGFANRALTIIWSRSTGGSICSVKDSLQGTLRSGRSGTIRSSWPVTQSVISSKFRNRFLFDRQP